MKIKKVLAGVLFVLLLGACTPQYHIDNVFGSDAPTAHRVAKCESNYNPNAVSPTGDHGIFQINEATWNKPWHSDPVAQWIGKHWHLRYDPYWNSEMAKRIKDKYGWGMWVCY